MRIAVAAVLLIPLALVSAACESNECGPGTHQVAGGCVPSLPPTCGPGTDLVDAVCIPVEGQDIECGAMTHLEDGACVGDVDVPGNATRYIEVVLSKPGTVNVVVNPIIADALAAGDMIILTIALQPTTDEMWISAGPGVLDDEGFFDFTGEFAYETPATFDPSGFSTESFTWVIAGLTDQPIVIVDTVITEGKLDIDSGPRLVMEGKLTGVITPENAMAVTLSPMLTLLQALVGFGVEADVDWDGVDGGEDWSIDGKESWEAIARFRAVPVWNFPALPE